MEREARALLFEVAGRLPERGGDVETLLKSLENLMAQEAGAGAVRQREGPLVSGEDPMPLASAEPDGQCGFRE